MLAVLGTIGSLLVVLVLVVMAVLVIAVVALMVLAAMAGSMTDWRELRRRLRRRRTRLTLRLSGDAVPARLRARLRGSMPAGSRHFRFGGPDGRRLGVRRPRTARRTGPRADRHPKLTGHPPA